MKNILKYLKGHYGKVVIILLFLVVQALCDLALPAYTSDIVDIGISNGGIEHASPEVIRQSEYEKIKLLLEDEEVSRFEDAYEVMEQETLTEAQWNKYKTEFPLMEQETLMRRTVYEQKELEELDKSIKSAIMFLSQLPEEQLQALQQLPEEQKNIVKQSLLEAKEKAVEEMGSLADTYIDAGAVSYVKSEYETIGVDMSEIQNNYLWVTGVKMLGVSLLAMITAVVVGLIASKISASVGMSLRGNVFKKVLSFSNMEMNKFSTASLITRSTNDIQQVQMTVVILLRMVCYAPIIGIGGVIKVLSTNASMAWIIGVAVLAIVCLVLILMVLAMPKFKILQTLIDKLNLVSREILTGLPVIRAFSTEKHEKERFEDANQTLTKTQLFTNRVMAGMMPAMMLVMNSVTIMIIWFGAKGIDVGDLKVGDMMAFITYTMQIVMAFLMLTMMSIMLPRAIVSANRIEEVLSTEVSIHDGTISNSKGKGVVSFDHVSFRYPGAEEYAIEDITFTARPGETTAFIGSTGSGKSTIINLIPRFFDTTEGKVLIDGVDVRELVQADLRESIGYVPQKGVLFSGTIESNIKYGKEDLTEIEMKKAVAISQSMDFIEAKPEQYQSTIAQGGSNVSGGQKQRLSIARAIAKEPKIYIFDDSFSALDYKTDVALRKALKDETEDSTVLIVAQRIGTIIHADQIIVLDDGKIVGMGTHEELLANNENYQQIAYSQLSQEELKGGRA